MLPWFTLLAVSLLLSVSQGSATSLMPRSDSCDPVCTPTADINPADPDAHICTDTVILMVAQCNDCEDQLSEIGEGGTEDAGDISDSQAEVDSFVSACNIAGFKVKDITVNGTYTGFNTSVVGSSQGAGSATPAATETAASAGVSSQSKPNGSQSNKLGASVLLALILVALGSATF